MKPERNKSYLAFVRKLPCCICGKTWGVEAAHSGPHGVSQKAPDTSALPLCRIHHRDSKLGLDRIGRAAWEELHGVSIDRLILLTQLRADSGGVIAFDLPQERKPVERIRRDGLLRGSRLAR